MNMSSEVQLRLYETATEPGLPFGREMWVMGARDKKISEAQRMGCRLDMHCGTVRTTKRNAIYCSLFRDGVSNPDWMIEPVWKPDIIPPPLLCES
jgi:hypothetical protein